MTSGLIGQKLRFILTNNFHYTGRVVDEDESTLTIIDAKSVRVTIAKHSILIQEEVGDGN